MAKVTIKLLDFKLWRDKPLFDREALKIFARIQLLHPRAYTDVCTYSTNVKGVVAAEEAFDLTNNPSRQEERLLVYGNERSVSSGDIVEVDGVLYLCCSVGWERL